MPKRPTFIHPVRAVRQAVADALEKPLTQPAFAKMVGVSAATIQSVELGRLVLSRDLANRICLVTGAEPLSLMKKHGKPLTVDGWAFSRSSFLLHKEFYDGLEDTGESSRKKAGLYLDSLLRAAAASPGKDNRLLAVLLSFDQWLQKARHEFGLVKASATALEELTATRHKKTGKRLRGDTWRAVYWLYDQESRTLNLLKTEAAKVDEAEPEGT